MHAWYLIYSKPHQEQVAWENLDRQSYRAYLPMVRTRKRLRGKRRTVIEPMFPRYLFVHLNDVDDDWGPIRSTKGVARLVRFGSTPAVVPAAFVEMLREHEDEPGIQSLPAPCYKPGDRVRIAEGPMAGYEAVFTAATGKERVLLLLDIAGTAAKLQVDVDQIEPVSPPW